MSQDLPSVGEIIRDYRMRHDISVNRFAAAIGRSRKWVYFIEKNGKGYERTWAKMGAEYPELKTAIINLIGRYPPQEYARIHNNIQAGRANLKG
jgi:DNA-binding XRE family transcriptional regulator